MANYLVTTLADENDAGATVAIPGGNGLSLREALILASGSAGSDTITFAANLTGGSTYGVDDGRLRLTGGALVIDSDVTISGDAVGSDHVADITIDGNSRVFDITAGTSIIDALVITGGFVFSGESGGGIRIASGADLTVDHSTISGNYAYAGSGGGISNAGTLTLTNSTLAENRAGGYSTPGGGGGLFNASGAVANLTNVTVYGNSVYGSGGGILNEGTATLTNVTVTGNFLRGSSGDGGGIYNDGTATLANSIVAGNFGHSAASELRDGATPTTFLGVNIIGVGSDTDAFDHVVETASIGDVFAAVTASPNNAPTHFQAGKLAANGGPVETVALAQLRTNAAIDAGDDMLAPLADARGQARADAPGVGNDGSNYSDLGAFEIAVSAGSLEPPSLVVTTGDDVVDWTDGVTSLREALTLANSAANGGDALGDGLPDVITFDPTLAGHTLTLTNGELVITDDVTIDGDVDGDDRADITIDGNGQSRVFRIAAGTATLDALVITGGNEQYSGYGGGGIRVESGASAEIIGSTISGNEARSGSGIWSDGTLTLTSSTIAGNSGYGGKGSGGGGLYVGSYSTATLVDVTVHGNSGGRAGGVSIGYHATATLTNTTITGNSGYGGKGGSAGGIFNLGTATLTDSIVAGNSSGGKGAAEIGGGYYGASTFHGLNIVGVGSDTDASDHVIQTASLADLFESVFTLQPGGKGGGELLAGGLADNGGPVETVALARLLGNPAIDVGDHTLAAVTDARGEARVDVPGVGNDSADFSDLGAFEAQVSGPLEAASLVVTTADDVIDWSDGVTSLREALALANSGANGGDALNDGLPDVITFDSALAGHTLTLTNGPLAIASNLTIEGDIDGDGISDITVDANGLSRVFDVTAGTSTLDALVITGGHATGSGGGIRIGYSAGLTINHSSIVENEAGQYARGGGISNSGILTLMNSTIANNNGGGGINNYFSGSATLANVTIYRNQGYLAGGLSNGGTATLINATITGNAATGHYFGTGGIYTLYAGAGATTLINSIVAGNYGKSGNAELGGGGSTSFLGLNIVSVGSDTDGADHVINTASLTGLFAHVTTLDLDGPGGLPAFDAGALENNGGAVQTVAIKPGGPAQDTSSDADLPADTADLDHDGNSTEKIPFDARGTLFARIAGGQSDVGAFEQQSFVVTTLEDETYGGGTLASEHGDGNGLSLREALALAGAAGAHIAITFDPSLASGDDPGVDDGRILLTNGELTISGDVTISGDGDGDGRADILLDADLNSRVIHVTGGVSTLNALVLTAGSVDGSDSGGGILVDQIAALAVNNSIVAGNHADGSGGGIANDGLLILNNVLLATNTAGAGGGVHNGGTGTALVTNTTIYGNYADIGGGMVNDGTATLTNVTVTGNAADVGGGGVGNAGNLTLTNSIVAGNDAPSDADYSELGTTTTTGHNLFSQAGVGDAGDTAGADIADIFRGTGVVLYTGAEGGRLGDNGGPTPTVAIKAGGLAHNATGTILPGDITDADRDGNTGEPLPVDARDFARDVDGIDIGAVELQNGATYTVTTLDDEEFDGGDLADETADGGGLSLREALALTNADPASPDTINFDADLIGGTLLLVHGELLVTGDTEITGEMAGGIDADITIDAGGASRVFSIVSGTATLNGLIMTGGDSSCGCGPAAAYSGGAVSVGAYFHAGYANVTISNSQVRNSFAYYGGGISVDTGSSLRLLNTTVTGNDADIGGGIAVNPGATLTTINATISDNHAAGFYGYGGGVAINGGGAATLINTTISGNTAYSGGGIYNSSDLTLINVTIANNSAIYGGGIYSTPCGCATADVFNSTITGNVAEDSGGGIYHHAGTLNLTNSIVAGNAAYAGPDIIALDTVNYGGKNVFSQGGVGRGGIDIFAPDTATIFASLVTIDPSPADGDEVQAGLLADNGGPVQTVAIRFAGDAYNNGDNTALPDDTEDLDGDTVTGEDLPFDARGLARVALGNVDIGAFEIQTPPVNGAPVNNVPGTQEIEANTATAIVGLLVSDADAGGASITTTLSVTHGTLSVISAGGAAVAGSGTNSVTLTGSVGQINTTLAAADNVVYTGAHDFFGTDTLIVLTNDGGNTGTGGAQTDTDNVTLNVNTLINGTPGDDAYEALRGREMINGFGGVDTVSFNFRLVDAQVSYEGNKVIIDGPNSHTVLTGIEVFVFTDGTVHNDDGSPLIDDLFYYAKYHDVWDAHLDADAHYNLSGWHEGRDPDAFFSTNVYLSANPDVAAAGVNPLTHFDTFGWHEGRVPSITFDPAHYLAANPDVAAVHVDPLWHFLQFGASEGRQPFAPTELIASNGFDCVYYLNHNPDVAAAGVDPFQHFRTIGWHEGRNPNALFDVNGYLANYPDVAAANVDPLDHYNRFGWHEGRDPSVGFDTSSYLVTYPDVAAAHINPLAHFLQFGIHEGRSPFADGVWG